MHKFPITEYTTFAELPLQHLDELKFSVYVLDFDWNYLFINDFVKKNLGDRGNNLIGENMWVRFPELANDSSFMLLKRNMENGIVSYFQTTSPINAQRLKITGYPLEDCYYFTSSILPNKFELMLELRNELTKKS